MHHSVNGKIFAVFGAAAVGDFEVEALVFDVGDDARVRFYDTAEFAFPAAIENGVVDMAAMRSGLPKVGLGGVEADEVGGTGGIVRIEDGLDGAVV